MTTIKLCNTCYTMPLSEIFGEESKNRKNLNENAVRGIFMTIEIAINFLQPGGTTQAHKKLLNVHFHCVSCFIFYD